MNDIRQAVHDHLPLCPFDPQTQSFIFTDASTSGLGYILIQVAKDKSFGVISCGSTGLTPDESRYSMYDLELSAVSGHDIGSSTP